MSYSFIVPQQQITDAQPVGSVSIFIAEDLFMAVRNRVLPRFIRRETTRLTNRSKRRSLIEICIESDLQTDQTDQPRHRLEKFTPTEFLS